MEEYITLATSTTIILIPLLILFIQGGIIAWCTRIAQENNRNVPLAAFFATLFGIFAVIVYGVMGDK